MKTNVFPRIFAALVLLAALFACQKPDDETIPVLKVPQPMILATGGSQSLEVASTVAWTLSVEYGGTSTGWIKLSQNSGEAAIGVKIQMTVDPNGGENRRATLVLKGTTLSTSVEISQMGTSVSDAPLWLELPALDRAGFFFGTHDMKGGAYAGAGKSGVRNYSFYWDPNGRVSFWVAYPLNKDLCGTGNYNYDWTQAYDPMVPEDQQPNLTEHSYGGRGWDGEYWNRGHQMPRADRQLTQESVMSTCRATNITPQCSSFNGGIWGDLEVWVRGRAKELNPLKDTMYVVTGCVQEGSDTWTDNYYQAAVKVPAAYFKACLRRSGSSYTALAFYLPQTKDAYDKGVFTSGNFKDYSLSVTDLEKKLNTTFFVNLENLPGMDKAKATSIKNTKANW